MNQLDSPRLGNIEQNILRSASVSVYDLFQVRALQKAGKTAIRSQSISLNYTQLLERVDKLAALLSGKGVAFGDRIAVLSENRHEYIELHLASAKIGAIVACQNWRLTPDELKYCITLVSPTLLVYSDKQKGLFDKLGIYSCPALRIGEEYERGLSSAVIEKQRTDVPTESGLIILYTSGTTGPAKAALISHRAFIARMTVLSIDLNIDHEDAFLAWAPMFHIGGSEHSLSTLMMGGSVLVSDGFDAEYMASVIGDYKLGWLLLVPATIDRLTDAMERCGTSVKGIKAVGSMPDLIPKSVIQELTTLFRAPFFNTFGATETGLPPASGDLIPIGTIPSRLSKKISSMCLMRLVGENDEDVAASEVGEALVRGPTLFSGYWGAAETNARDFRDGWFRMGDLFRNNGDGTVDFVGRSKYLIKSGGENIYPAEIENVLMSDPGVSDAVVVRKSNDKWGEIPVAVVSRTNTEVQREYLLDLCRSQLAGYKRPRELYFVGFDKFPRNSNGKIIREQVEEWLKSRQNILE